ncbi:hypothetical protein [Caenimonas aquaedulcis]|uniref:DUF4062 domain-containing protein n=1 Tax=Caenimonas aquaedulcis TaxID=2793270 RepID=A0A931H851_9BURK|nr:hypothetical protein [Caenimonas aquaedulcis]MBG9390090.1 hypothetical protein [Caenimonas aquaedulcis]
MPRTEDVLTIFLASPSDVSDERSRFAEVIADWNRAWSRELGLRLELVRWEDDAFPGIGVDAQDVINRQLPADYDLFVGVMWSRFGTPTGRAGSGTKEEFDRALARYREAPDSLDILFYFKDAPISPSKLDPHQLAKVLEFKASLQDTGLLSWDFSDLDQFKNLVELHLTRHVQAWRKRRDQGTDVLGPSTTTSIPVIPDAPARESESEHVEEVANDEEDAGYIDLLEVFTERSAEMAEIALRLGAAQAELTEHTTKGTQELDELRIAGKQVPPAVMRRSIGRIADEMLRFTTRVEAEIPLFRTAADRSMSALVKVATLAAELAPDQVAETKAAASTLLATLAGARGSIGEFRDTTAALPRMTKELNVAKRKQVAALERLVGEFENAERLVTEAIAVIDALPTPGAPHDA